MPKVKFPTAIVNAFSPHNRFLGWNWVDQGGRLTKPPFQIRHPNRLASITDPTTWASYAEARKAIDDFDGIGFCLTGLKHIAAIDLDDVIVDGEITPEAQAIINQADSYCERTPSGAGLRIIGSTRKPELHKTGIKLKVGHAEIYRAGPKRFITISGQQIGDHTQLKNIDAVMDRLLLKAAGSPLHREEEGELQGYAPKEPKHPPEYYLRQAEIVLQSRSTPRTHSNTVWKILMDLIDGGFSSPIKLRVKVKRSNIWPLLTGYDERRLREDIDRALQKKGIAT